MCSYICFCQKCTENKNHVCLIEYLCFVPVVMSVMVKKIDLWKNKKWMDCYVT